MNASTGRRSSLGVPLLSAALAAAVAILITQCRSPMTTSGKPEPPPFGDVATAPRSAVLTYVATLRFDSTPPAADSATFRTGANGSLVRFDPEVGAGTYTDEELGAGRIISRLTARGAPNPLDAPTGISYAWVDRGPSGWRMRLVPADSAVAVVTKPMLLGREPYPDSEPAHDRVAADFFLNFRCGRWCCAPMLPGLTQALLDSLFAPPAKR